MAAIHIVVWANLHAQDSFTEKSKIIRGTGGVVDKKAYFVYTTNITSQLQFFVACRLIFNVSNVFDCDFLVLLPES
jgi:hypothetical protein